MKRRTSFSLASASMLILAAAPATAATVIDTGPPTASSSISLNGIQQVAGSFTIANATTLTSVAGFFRNVLPSTLITTTIKTSTATNLPGLSLFDISFSTGSTPGYYGGMFGANTLTAGTYFVEFSANGIASLATSASAPAQYEAVRPTNGTYRNSGTLGLSFSLAGEALTGAVPEPATWVMMIGGFGLIGSVMRRRTMKVAYA